MPVSLYVYSAPRPTPSAPNRHKFPSCLVSQFSSEKRPSPRQHIDSFFPNFPETPGHNTARTAPCARPFVPDFIRSLAFRHRANFLSVSPYKDLANVNFLKVLRFFRNERVWTGRALARGAPRVWKVWKNRVRSGKSAKWRCKQFFAKSSALAQSGNVVELRK